MLSFLSGLAPPAESFDAEVAASALIASLASSGDAPAAVSPHSQQVVWDRPAFLQACTANNTLLTELLEDWLADAFPTAPLLSSALEVLFLSLESDVDAMCAARLASFQSAASGSGLSPPHVASMVRSRAFQSHVRETLSVWLLDEAHFLECGREAVGVWRGRSQPAVPPPSATHVSRLCDLAGLHMRLTLWPQVVDANVMLRFPRRLGGGGGGGGAGSDSTSGYDSAMQTLFSLTGKPVGEGARVVAVGPRLMGREPLCSLGGEGGARAALPADLKDLGGAGCRGICIELPEV